MGQNLCCLSFGNRNTKVVPFSTMPNTSNLTLLAVRNASFHRPVRSSLERFSVAETSNRSSFTTISIGSVETLSSEQSPPTNKEPTKDENQESTPSTKRHPGLLTPEPNDNILNSALLHSKAAQGCSSYVDKLPQMIGGGQSRGKEHLRVSASVSRVPTPRPNESGVIMVKPYQGSNIGIPEEPERVCKHGIPLTGVTGDPHEVNCALCERPISRGGRVLAGMMESRRAERKKLKNKRLLNRQRLIEEQERGRRTTEEVGNVLHQFVERHQNAD